MTVDYSQAGLLDLTGLTRVLKETDLLGFAPKLLQGATSGMILKNHPRGLTSPSSLSRQC